MGNEPRQRLLDEFERAAHTIADAMDDPASWARVRGEVTELIARGNQALARRGSRGDEHWIAITWGETDPPVVLARAFGVVHRRLARPRQAGGPQAEPPGAVGRLDRRDEPLVINFARLALIETLAG